MCIAPLVALAISGALYQHVNTHIDAIKYPPLGAMIDVGGYILHINCSGHGTPTVILDAFLGGSSLDWTLVQPLIAQFTRVCSYDRAGLGWSQESPRARNSKNIAIELHTLLHNAGIMGPYILVGHSSGGINMRFFANMYPDEVAGIILVDSSHEDQLEKLPTEPQTEDSVDFDQIVEQRVKKFPETIKSMYVTMQNSIPSKQATKQENMCFAQNLKELKNIDKGLSNKPLIVISAGKALTTEECGLNQKYLDELAIEWRKLQNDLVSKSKYSKHLIAHHSSHMIPHKQPEIIIQAVKEMIQTITS